MCTDLSKSPDSVVLAPFEEPSDLEKEKSWTRTRQSRELGDLHITHLSARVILPNHGLNVSA